MATTSPPITSLHVFPAKLTTTTTKKISLSSSSSLHRRRRRRKVAFNKFGTLLLSLSSSSSSSRSSAEETTTKEALYAALQGINRGIFGVPSAKKAEIESLVRILESRTPNPRPTFSAEELGGEWRLIYSTVTILGHKRTKLGLRDFITLGDFYQFIDFEQGKAVNVIKFSSRGLGLLTGELRVEASFEITTETRVDIKFIRSDITPDQLMNVFRKNYDLLLSIFNPDGWLEITYVDESLRIGRDNKGNMFILERQSEENP